MKITKSQLKQIIKEEFSKVLRERDPDLSALTQAGLKFYKKQQAEKKKAIDAAGGLEAYEAAEKAKKKTPYQRPGPSTPASTSAFAKGPQAPIRIGATEGPPPSGPIGEFEQVYKLAASMASIEGSSFALNSHIGALQNLFRDIPEGPDKVALQQQLKRDHEKISQEAPHLTQRSRLSVIEPFLDK